MDHARALSTATVIHVPLDRIVIGTRRREKPGRLRALAKSIEAHGLLHPILLHGDTLIAGERRLEACRSLHWKTIPARQVERLTPDELRAIELEENTAREALSDYATSKTRLAQIKQAEADLKAKAAEAPISVTSRDKKSGRGRPKGKRTVGSKRDVQAETGIDRMEQVRVERHVALAERYPALQRPGWVRHLVLHAGDAIDRIPDADRGAIVALVDQDAIPPKTVIAMLTHAADMTTAARRAVIEQSTSEDEIVRRTAGTTLARVPPPPDPGLLALNEVVEDYRKAAAQCRSALFKPRIAALSTSSIALRDEFRAHEQKERSHGNSH